MFDLGFTVPEFLLRSFTNVKIPAFKDAQLCKRFLEGREEIRPVIFSHGLSGDKNFYTSVCLALAAHGYLVISFNHQDRSCLHTYDKDGKEIFFESKPLYAAPYRAAQIQTRTAEALSIIEVVASNEFDNKVSLLGAGAANIKIAVNELVLAGHSFGSATMAATANKLDKESQPKALLLMDLWCFPILDEIQSSRLKFRCPVQLLHSEYFHPSIKKFKSWSTILKMLDSGIC